MEIFQQATKLSLRFRGAGGWIEVYCAITWVGQHNSIRFRTKFYPGGHDRRGRLDCPQIFLYCFHKVARIVCALFCAIGAIIWKPGLRKPQQAMMQNTFATLQLGRFMLDFERSWQGSLFKILAFKKGPCHGDTFAVNLSAPSRMLGNQSPWERGCGQSSLHWSNYWRHEDSR